MKSYPIIMQDFSIAGIKKQWEKQRLFIAGDEVTLPNKEIGYVTDVIGEKITVRNSKSPYEKQTFERSEIYCHRRIYSEGQPNLFAGAKAETRRLTGLKEINKNPDEWTFLQIGDSGQARFKPKGSEVGALETWIKCPYGVIGDEIYVKDSFANGGNIKQGFIYKADNYPDDFKKAIKWKSPLYMPREASRITLINAGVSIERLQSITEEGAIREGIKDCGGYFGLSLEDKSGYVSKNSALATIVYEEVWKHLHGEESWNLNPYVWVLRFTVKEFK